MHVFTYQFMGYFSIAERKFFWRIFSKINNNTITYLLWREKKYCFCNKYNKNPLMICPLCYIPMYFWNVKDDLKKNRMDAIFLVRYRDRLFPFLVECFIMNESSIAAFAGPFITIYDSKRTFLIWFRCSDFFIDFCSFCYFF